MIASLRTFFRTRETAPAAALAVNCVLAALIAAQTISFARSWLSMRAPATKAAAAAAGSRRAAHGDVAADIVRGHLFGAVPRPDDSAATAPLGAAGYALKGLIDVDDPEKGLAIIAGPDGRSKLYRVGDAIAANLMLSQVMPQFVILLRGSEAERLAFSRGSPLVAGATARRGVGPRAASVATAAAPGPGAITPETHQTLQYLGFELQQDGQGHVTGLSGTGPDTWRKSGILPSDIVLAIDDRPIDEVVRNASAFETAMVAAVTNVTVLRNGSEITIQAKPESVALGPNAHRRPIGP